MKNKKGESTVILGIIAFIVAIFFFSFTLPLIRSLINNIWANLSGLEQFMIIIIPFIIFFLILFALLKLLGGGE